MIGFQVGIYNAAAKVLDQGNLIRKKTNEDIKEKPATEILDPIWLTCQHT